MKGKALRKHSLREKLAALVLLKPFISTVVNFVLGESLDFATKSVYCWQIKSIY